MSGGFTFGAKTTAPSAFGSLNTTFGSTTHNQVGLGFGSSMNPTSTTEGFQFGTSTASFTPTNLFKSPGNSLITKPSGFGTPVQTTGLFSIPSTGINFTPAPSNIGFGTANTTTTSTTSGLFTAPVTTGSHILSLGTSGTSTPGLSFSTSKAPVTVGGGFFGSVTSTGANVGTFNIITPKLGTSTTPSTAGGLNFGIGSTNPVVPTCTTFGSHLTVATSTSFNSVTTAPVVVGLGGLVSCEAKLGAAITTQKEIPPKEQPLPNEIFQTVEHFKEIVKQEKLYSSDIARCSVRDFKKVEQEIDLLNNLLNDVESYLQKNRHLAEKLKHDTAKCLQNIEIAQRTQDTPPGLQYENTAPLKFFLDLADYFERDTQTLKIQIETADKYVKNHKNPDTLTTQDLALGMRRLHETFVALAGRLQSVHNQVESQKEIYLNILRQVYNDSTNPFHRLNEPMRLGLDNLKNVQVYASPKIATGPTPFTNLSSGNGNPLVHQNQASNQYHGTSTNVAPIGM